MTGGPRRVPQTKRESHLFAQVQRLVFHDATRGPRARAAARCRDDAIRGGIQRDKLRCLVRNDGYRTVLSHRRRLRPALQTHTVMAHGTNWCVQMAGMAVQAEQEESRREAAGLHVLRKAVRAVQRMEHQVPALQV